MKYYIEYKDKEQFNKINDYYKANCAFVDSKRKDNRHSPGFIIENNQAIWKYTSNLAPSDAKKITFEEWEEMTNPKLEWKVGSYVKYLGTKEGTSSGHNWEEYFNRRGLKAGDVGVISSKKGTNTYFFIEDNIRGGTSGRFTKTDLQLITKEEYEAGLRNPTKNYEFNEGDLVVVTMFDGKSDWNDVYTPHKQGEILKLGGKYWGNNNCTIEKVNKFKSFPFISKIRPDGDAYEKITGLKFRHATPEEIAYYNKVGLGANINDMKKDDLPNYPKKSFEVSNGSFEGKTIYPATGIPIKKQSLAEQLCKIIEKEPVNIPVISLFPTKRKSSINKLKF